MVLAAGGLTWLSLHAGTSEIWPINFVWMCFPTSDLFKVDGVAACRWVRHSIIHHVSIHCFIDVSWCFRFFHLNLCFIISSLHCIALFISLYSLLVASFLQRILKPRYTGYGMSTGQPQERESESCDPSRSIEFLPISNVPRRQPFMQTLRLHSRVLVALVGQKLRQEANALRIWSIVLQMS